MIAIDVAVAAPLEHTLTYRVPESLAARVAVGKRCLVPLGRRRVTGYCLAVLDSPPDHRPLKEIIDVLDPAPLFPPTMVVFFRWLADYYCHPIGEVIREALPGGLVRSSGRTVTLTDAGAVALASHLDDYPWLAELLERGRLSVARLRRLWPAHRRRLLAWQEQGFITIDEGVARDRIRIKTETCLRLPGTAGREDPSERPGTTPVAGDRPACFLVPVCGDCGVRKSERKTIELLLELGGRDRPVPRRDLTRRYPGARRVLADLIEKGCIAVEEIEVQRDPFGFVPPYEAPPAVLTPEQERVLADILPAIDARRFAAFLLHGVTGSGKTEVYLRAAAHVLEQGGGVLVLVPEIALASQLEAHFHSRFPGRVALLHSGLGDGERYDQWRLVAAGERPIVIGARSAVFAPLSRLRLVIVDEEHDTAYKQEDGLRYQARDVAVMRAAREGAVVVLGSATPSVASFFNVERGKYQLLTMTRRIEDRPLPAVEIVDLKNEDREQGKLPLFSHRLRTAIADTLARGEQALIFLNRRGFANFMVCRDCGGVVSCRHCQVSLTLHKGAGRLVCHYCGFRLPAATLCPACRGTSLQAVGFGTERLEEELRKLFPAAAIDRLDRDTSSNRRRFHGLLRRVRDGGIDILVGTQMITKGHHFPGVTLVGVVWADAGLGLPDFRAGERTFQLLSQVMGRAGRGEAPGRVVVQTIRPDHYAIECARRHDYKSFYSQELAFRKALGYPPFSRMACLGFEGETESETAVAAKEAGGRLGRVTGIRILGPAAAPLPRLRGHYRWQIVLQAPTGRVLHRACRMILAEPPAPCRRGRVRFSVDIDPENML